MRVQITIETPGLPRRPRRAFAALAIAMALVIPGVALASHLFADVPDSNPFHANITNLAQSGVTAGCGGDNYCPSTVVTREQMAAFLNRGLPRVALLDIPITPVPDAIDTVASFTITPGLPNGAVPGARQFVQVTATMTISLSDSTGCPCLYRAYIKVGSEFASPRVVDVTLTTVDRLTPIAVTGVAPVTGTTPQSVTIWMYRASGSGSATVYGQAVASTAMFGENGTSTLTKQTPIVILSTGADDGTLAR